MNSSLASADPSTHLKVVVIALLAATFVVAAGINARLAADKATPTSPRLEMPLSNPSVPAESKPSLGKMATV